VPPSTLTELGLPVSFADPIPFSQNVTFFIGKVDWQLASNHRLSLRYSGHRNNSPFNSSIVGGLYLGPHLQVRGPLPCGRGPVSKHPLTERRERVEVSGANANSIAGPLRGDRLRSGDHDSGRRQLRELH
jgi:hypothetical protein